MNENGPTTVGLGLGATQDGELDYTPGPGQNWVDEWGNFTEDKWWATVNDAVLYGKSVNHWYINHDGEISRKAVDLTGRSDMEQRAPVEIESDDDFAMDLNEAGLEACLKALDWSDRTAVGVNTGCIAPGSAVHMKNDGVWRIVGGDPARIVGDDPVTVTLSAREASGWEGAQALAALMTELGFPVRMGDAPSVYIQAQTKMAEELKRQRLRGDAADEQLRQARVTIQERDVALAECRRVLTKYQDADTKARTNGTVTRHKMYSDYDGKFMDVTTTTINVGDWVMLKDPKPTTLYQVSAIHPGVNCTMSLLPAVRDPKYSYPPFKVAAEWVRLATVEEIQDYGDKIANPLIAQRQAERREGEERQKRYDAMVELVRMPVPVLSHEALARAGVSLPSGAPTSQSPFPSKPENRDEEEAPKSGIISRKEMTEIFSKAFEGYAPPAEEPTKSPLEEALSIDPWERIARQFRK